MLPYFRDEELWNYKLKFAVIPTIVLKRIRKKWYQLDTKSRKLWQKQSESLEQERREESEAIGGNERKRRERQTNAELRAKKREPEMNSESSSDDEYVPSETEEDDDECRHKVEPREEMKKLKDDFWNQYAYAAARRKGKRKVAGELGKNKKSYKAARRRRVEERRKLKRTYESYMSLPSIISFYRELTPEQKEWLYAIGLGGLEFLKISSTSEEMNKFLFDHFDSTGYFEAHGKKV